MGDRPLTRNKRLVASAASDNATIAYDGPCILHQIDGFNAKVSTVYLKIYKLTAAQVAAATAPTNADTPFMTLALGASAPFKFDWADGVDFVFGLGFRLVTGSADNDATAVAANDVVGLNLLAR
jgi:hypothetical protein